MKGSAFNNAGTRPEPLGLPHLEPIPRRPTFAEQMLEAQENRGQSSAFNNAGTRPEPQQYDSSNSYESNHLEVGLGGAVLVLGGVYYVHGDKKQPTKTAERLLPSSPSGPEPRTRNPLPVEGYTPPGVV